MTHDRHGGSPLHTRKLTYTLSSLGPPMTPQSDGVLKNTVRKKIIHHRRLYGDLPDLIVLMSIEVNTSGHLYDDFLYLCFLYTHREDIVLVVELELGI